ncbi:MAG: NAD(P)H-hydrate dehydratase [Lachnospiraceae bacterium]|nr:NAD(P)H-hydrate dehydratase [Lachnospiraceae bacterium]
MEYIVTGDEMKEYDNNTTMHHGKTALELMENAANALVAQIMQRCPVNRVLIVCGIGNNGGDGLALARLLHDENIIVDICITGDISKSTESFKVQLSRMEGLQVRFITKEELLDSSLDTYSVIVDAIFGVGLSREINGEYIHIIEKCNSFQGYKLSVDIPSGICANTGKVMGCAFRADCTITFAFGKLGLYLFPGAAYAGEIIVTDIGITEQAFEGNPPHIFSYSNNPIEYLPIRIPDGNKGSFGKVLVIAGFETMAGAAILCSRSVLQMGAGMVKVICAPENRGILQSAVPEVLYGEISGLKESVEWADVVIIGPGLGKSEEVHIILGTVLKECELPMVIDADALNMISDNKPLQELLRTYGGSKVLTPHIGELSRMAQKSIKDVKENLFNVAKNIAKEYHCIVVGKDARTFVTEGDSLSYLNITGNNGMATAGSGDVLAGMIGALVGQGVNAFKAACTGVYLHGLAGDYARDIYTEYGVTASRLIENIRLFDRI